MCGIACFPRSNRYPNPGEATLAALKRLEHRGYDSFGLAAMKGGDVERVVALGAPSAHSEPLPAAFEAADVVIGHTRWATHGKVSEKNCHPVIGGRTWLPSRDKVHVVHNGIVENHQELRPGLRAGGWLFQTDTDTEALAHLVSDALIASSNEDEQVIEAVKSVTLSVTGSMAWVAVSPAVAESLVLMFGYADGAPLCVTEDGAIVSDPMCLDNGVRYARVPNKCAVAVRKSLVGPVVGISDLTGEFVVPEFDQIALGDNLVDPKNHHMESEILEQVNFPMTRHKTRSPDYATPDRLVLFGCGSSYNAALLARSFIENFSGVPVDVCFPHEVEERRVLNQFGNLFLAITQSGETKDVLSAVRTLQSRGANVGAVTNCAHSAAADLAGRAVTLLGVGPERSVAATKTFTATVLRLIDIGMNWGKSQSPYHLAMSTFATDLSVQLAMATSLENRDGPRTLGRLLTDFHRVLLVGSGDNYYVAREAALKLKEVAYIHAEALPAAELKHGPLALVDDTVAVVCIDTNAANSHPLDSVASEVAARGGYVVAVDDGKPNEHANSRLLVPATVAAAQPLVTNVCLQLVAYYAALAKGVNPDYPKNLCKTVTV